MMSEMVKKDLRSMGIDDMTALLKEMGQPAFRAKQLFGWVHEKQVQHIDDMHNLGKGLLAQLNEQCEITAMQLERKQVSKDGTEKFLFQLADGNYIECVLMRYRGDMSKQRNTLCISSQVGCAMGCTFCATGQGGFVRNLTVGEIVSQVYAVNHQLIEEGDTLPVGNVVLMGMGEPMLNLDNVLKAVALLNDPQGQQISIRRMTVSTCGVVPQMKAFADKKLDMVLAVSLHAPNDVLRSGVMPVNNRYPLHELMDACRYYQKQTRNRITFEYALIAGFNDQPEHVAQLKALLKGLDCHLNIIPVNPVANTAQFSRPDRKQVAAFVKALQNAGINASVREEKGTDIDGACGQLRGKVTGKQ
ncbi:MAG: 23S rRNA (adenine(2503)-C(2))-methyltransferase RlmN [Peptococcaceae bacterium]|nr:23S rRNA (adenine(2503)-C(2))-methyltransferase RlmN [Peptococcaceae bacterium]